MIWRNMMYALSRLRVEVLEGFRLFAYYMLFYQRQSFQRLLLRLRNVSLCLSLFYEVFVPVMMRMVACT
jgi:hypothetical protein